ncbi:hypothetical protein MGG_17489 [Pyricularia oryzae 70-15]|uniref:Uncharacterized protein n=1 Tax=Pyricularia oryzae (strain 70-15 / ATCC MYA-4617 / FGSC 8958) TaxID=242507 RepID=G4NDC0_PYRO7|nr:uncharacterized protein MGG_17489 [Pyricularia oryzae 70-15]EHA49258.1 hypothetical protein MGG_17489 [Pyricularia oryzae 70-15]
MHKQRQKPVVSSFCFPRHGYMRLCVLVRILLPPPPPRLPVARITRLAIDNNHPPVPSSPHLLGTSSPWLQTTDSSAVWTQAPLDEEPSTAVRRILRAPEGTGSRQ